MKKLLFTCFLAIYTMTAMAQGTIRGNVTDELGLDMPGATVLIEALNLGAVTDEKGDFTTVNENFVDADLTGGAEWTRFQPANGDTATLFGTEIAIQRQLDFLPGALKGLGVYFNYTYTNSTATGIRNEDGEERNDVGLPGTAPHMVNASLSYENEKLVLRASLNYAHDYIDELGGSEFSDRYYDRQLFVDVNGSYAFTKNFRFFFELNNLTNQPLRYYQGVRERTMQVEYYNMRLNAGLKFDLFKK